MIEICTKVRLDPLRKSVAIRNTRYSQSIELKLVKDIAATEGENDQKSADSAIRENVCFFMVLRQFRYLKSFTSYRLKDFRL